MTNCRFGGLTKHGRLAFTPGPVYGFDDPDAVPYFAAVGWAEETEDAADFVIPVGELDISPFAIFASGPSKHTFVVPARAALAAAEHGLSPEEALARVLDANDPFGNGA